MTEPARESFPALFLAPACLAAAVLAGLGYALVGGWDPWRFTISTVVVSVLGYVVTACLLARSDRPRGGGSAT